MNRLRYIPTVWWILDCAGLFKKKRAKIKLFFVLREKMSVP